MFRRGHPEWLNELIADRRGRQLIYELSAAHRNSLLLNYAIQRILKQVRLGRTYLCMLRWDAPGGSFSSAVATALAAHVLLFITPHTRLLYALHANRAVTKQWRYALVTHLRITSPALQGHEEEVLLVGGSLASYFEVYHRLLLLHYISSHAAAVHSAFQQPAGS